MRRKAKKLTPRLLRKIVLEETKRVHRSRRVRESLSGDHISKIQEYLRANARPGFNTYKCKDGRALFVCASDHVAHTRSFLETVGVYDLPYELPHF